MIKMYELVCLTNDGYPAYWGSIQAESFGQALEQAYRSGMPREGVVFGEDSAIVENEEDGGWELSLSTGI